MPSISTIELNTLVYNIAIYNSEASYKRLFCLLFTPLFRFSFCLLKSRELAEEVASDVMLRLWENRKEILEIENIQVYALVAARNISLNILKKKSRTHFISIDDIDVEINMGTLSPEQILINAQDKARIETSIKALPTKCKLVFKLVKEEGFTYKEVAEILNISPKTVDAHLVAAVKKLSEALRLSPTHI